MLRFYLRHLYRDRRRILLAVLLLIGAGALGDGGLPDVAPGFSGEALVLLLGFALIPLVTLSLPRHRDWIEVVALASLLVAAIFRILPEPPASMPPGDRVFPVLLAWGLAIATTRFLLYGRWADRLGRRRSLRLRVTLRSEVDLRALWYGLLPLPGHLDRHADPEVIAADYLDAAHRCIRVISWPPEGPPGESLLMIEALRPFSEICLRREVISGLTDTLVIGRTCYRFRDFGLLRHVDVSHRISGAPPRRMLRAWLDDTMGRLLDQRVARIERGLGREATPEARAGLSRWFEEPVVLAPPQAPRRRLSDLPTDIGAEAPTPRDQSGSISPSSRVA